ncbi:RagB/SusD family nutrient uptake outer membrane protein [Pedobacter sp. HMWF019]|uniref:RagB/SusD family nutrient uptake outer membrane protein n=1 Tax=Pedobacter sp. HMWF019 TaxID=2056856 RepID=UPI000D332805|nr:RagB/SusD family nutrient uptake outer membrane protein [Pedobacter sp. HMWF019]PTT04256.1 RagB/SusD family nutrient uptake outer membrane protein [Pedobacter sp. HMWF019]
MKYFNSKSKVKSSTTIGTISIMLPILLLITPLFLRCKKFVELDPPNTLLVTGNVFQNDANASAAMTGIYSQMVEQNLLPYEFPLFTGLCADELKTNLALFKPVYQNGLQPVDAATNIIWTLGYNFIYQANVVYEGCNASTTLSPAVKKQLMAEALFIRAYWHFYLVNLYGDIPLITSSIYIDNATASRTPKAQVYQQIITDLKNAQGNLNENYVAANSIATTTDRIRPNKYAATALLARVYLYTNNYADAETQATAVINNSSVYSTSTVDVNSVFLKNSKEAIWQLAKPTPTNSINTYEGASFILTAVPSLGLQKSSTISTQLLNAFEPGDLRRNNWIGKFTSGSVDYYFPYKYKVETSATITEYSMVLRVAEQYLIRAEARAQQNNLPGAIGDIDVIRLRAGVSLIAATNTNISKTNLLAAILDERQRELFTEGGHRWLDLKRTGTIDAVMTAVAPSKGTTWNTAKQLWPIPQKEIGNDVNLVQNPGYN